MVGDAVDIGLRHRATQQAGEKDFYQYSASGGNYGSQERSALFIKIQKMKRRKGIQSPPNEKPKVDSVPRRSACPASAPRAETGRKTFLSGIRKSSMGPARDKLPFRDSKHGANA